ncbi:MAG: hypothetical protein JOZ56_03570 [Actinobacteria bacterium]|nr:hypothetical protein [Actinomycetota bacterium]MBV8562147.1 hypothetical protein [Actinomycetota bacterium]
MIRKKRIESTSGAFAVRVDTWDDETGEAMRVEYDGDGRPLRRAVVTRFPREAWDDDVVGEAVWYDGHDRVLRRRPVLLGRALVLDE